MARYSVLRLLMFFGFVCALWLLGLRDESQRWWLLGGSALGSMALSFFVLQGPRSEFSATIARRVDERARRAERAGRQETDEFAEDNEDTDIVGDTEGVRDTEGVGDTEGAGDTGDSRSA